jgi:hypothetical protein
MDRTPPVARTYIKQTVYVMGWSYDNSTSAHNHRHNLAHLRPLSKRYPKMQKSEPFFEACSLMDITEGYDVINVSRKGALLISAMPVPGFRLVFLAQE